MKTLKVCKATPVHDGECIEGVVLEINSCIPRNSGLDWEAKMKKFYSSEADTIMEALSQLPQGTKHALLIKMLEKQVCLLRIP
jgi:hypothetical protein